MQTTETVDIGAKVSDFFGFKCITELVFRVVDAAIIGAGILLLVYLVYGGVEWLTSGGDKAKLESARAKLTNALIGVAIIAASFASGKLSSPSSVLTLPILFRQPSRLNI